jgi:hypothetical protein
MVFEDLPLDAFGARLPNLSFEVLGAGATESDEPQLEQLVQGVCLIPASGEFAYATEPVFREVREGEERAENVHTSRAFTNLDAALDDLEARLPKVTSVALVTSWFGMICAVTSARSGPGSRRASKPPGRWTGRWQGSIGRARIWCPRQTARRSMAARRLTRRSSLAIRALKQRGYQVTLYPFILMDVPG